MVAQRCKREAELNHASDCVLDESQPRKMADKDPARTQCTAPELLLKVVLVGTLSHYETRGMIDDKRLEHMLHAGKQILYKSHQESDVR